MMPAAALDLPEVRAELEQVFHDYERALMTNDVDALNRFFWADPRVTRYGIADRQLGHEEQAAFRAATPAPTFTRELRRLRLVTYGTDMATAQVEFIRSDTPLHGFQSQTWVRFAEGWRIVAAHVSMVPFDAD